MTIDELPDIVYHGTVSLYENSLKDGINLNCSKKYVDFGAGFYTTLNYNQAQEFAFKRAELKNSIPMIVTYKINKELLLDLNYLLFDDTNDKWCEFVYNNRMKPNCLISDFHNKKSQFDIVYGNVADGSVGYYTRKAQKERIDYQEFINSVKFPYDDNYNQLSFHTERSLKALLLSNIQIMNKKKEDALC